MSSKKIIHNKCKSCELEKQYLGGDAELNDCNINCNTYVNPNWKILVGKLIYNTIGAVVVNPNLNTVISRVPINKQNIEFNPYDLSVVLETSDEISLLIPNQYNMLYGSDIDIRKKFLLGADIENDGILTCIGFLINNSNKIKIK